MQISDFGVERRWDICGRCNVNPKVRNKTVSCRLSDFVFGLFLACKTFCLICGASMLVCFKGLRFSLPSAPFVFPQSFQRVIEGLMPHSFDLHHFLTYQWFPSCFYARYILLFQLSFCFVRAWSAHLAFAASVVEVAVKMRNWNTVQVWNDRLGFFPHNFPRWLNQKGELWERMASAGSASLKCRGPCYPNLF